MTDRHPRPRSSAARLAAALLLFTGLAAGGCASVSVQPQITTAGKPPVAPAQRPRRIVVEAFTFPEPARVRVDRQGAELAALERRLQERLRERTMRELTKLGVEAVPVEAGQGGRVAPADGGRSGRGAAGPRGEPAWVVTGQFTRVNQGSRALRIAIGLGTGGTKMETAVRVFDRSTPAAGAPVLAFRTTGGSGAEPGLISAGGPVNSPLAIAIVVASVVETAAGSGGHGITEDADRTARMIAAYLSEELARRGYCDAASVKRAQRLGGAGGDAS